MPTERMLKVTVDETIWIDASPEKVWDYTQDWHRRPEWDDAVVAVISQSDGPPRRVHARFQGGMIFNIEYKLDDRPKQTSLTMRNEDSKWLLGGGGSWRYEPEGSGTT